MTYSETIAYLFRQLPMFQRVGPTAFKKDLSNILHLAKALGQPQEKFKSIHIGGTNGKGSTAHMISAVLQASGLKVGLYTSPHYKDFRERIKINGTFISEQAVIEFVEQNKTLIEEVSPSFFEITVALAFDYFAKENVDVAVIEVGMGGRLDSTNIISPLVSVITNISYDHMQYLGDTLPLIAKEKAGIIKENIPVVIGERQEETTDVFMQTAATVQAPIVFADDHYHAQPTQINPGSIVFDVFYEGVLKYPLLRLQLGGSYQVQNLQTSLQAIQELEPHFNISEEAIRTGLKDLRSLTNFMGRWQILSERPMIICESAHNEAGIAFAMNQIKELSFKQLHFVLGTVNDKDVPKMLKQLPHFATYYFAKADIPRGLEVDKLAQLASEAGLKGQAYSSVRSAFEAAKTAAHEDDLIFIGGSIFVVAEVL